MNKTLSLIAITSTVLLLNGCAKEEAAPAPAPTPAPAATPAPAPVVPPAPVLGGYEPSAEERIPGVTVDAATLEADKKANDEAMQKAYEEFKSSAFSEAN